MAEVNAPPIRPRAPGPATVRAAAGVVDVWRADLGRVENGLEELLCAEERARAARILGERERILWARSRGVLRALLGRYLDRDPRELRFVLGPYGKPALVSEGPTRPGPTEDLRFNLSHSGGLALYAVTVGREVGVDVEVPCRRVDEVAVAARVLGREQARRLASIEDPVTRAQEFTRAWVAHEAAVKCPGLGLATPPADTQRDDLWSTQLDVGPRASAAVTVEGGRCDLRCREWRG
jgi:4'-phosphopantetheinyl transferase